MEVDWDKVCWERHGQLSADELLEATRIVKRDLGENHTVSTRRCRFPDCVYAERVPKDEFLLVVCINEGRVVAVWD